MSPAPPVRVPAWSVSEVVVPVKVVVPEAGPFMVTLAAFKRTPGRLPPPARLIARLAAPEMLMRPVPPSNPAPWVTPAWASMVPAAGMVAWFKSPSVKMRVPVATSVSELDMVKATPVFLLIVTLKKVSLVVKLMVAAAPEKTAVPLLWVKVPPAVWVKPRANVVVPELAVNVPADRV